MSDEDSPPPTAPEPATPTPQAAPEPASPPAPAASDPGPLQTELQTRSDDPGPLRTATSAKGSIDLNKLGD